MNWYKNIKIAVPLPEATWSQENQPSGTSGIRAVNKYMTEEDAKKQTEKHPGLALLGGGSYGIAYSKGDVAVKYTTDKSEVQSAKIIFQKQNGKPLPGIVQVFDIEKVNEMVFSIIIEKVNPVPKNEIKILSILLWNRDMLPNIRNNMNYYEKINKDLNSSGINTNASDDLDNVIDKASILTQNIIGIGGSLEDLHTQNVGCRKTGEYVILDLGGLF